MIDWHCHILPGLDDGPATPDEAVELAAALCRAGFTTVYCTPHLIRRRYEVDNERVRHAVGELQSLLREREIDLTLVPGREYCMDEYLGEYLQDPLPLGDSAFILVEIPAYSLPDLVVHSFRRMIAAGYTPVIAHPERCPLFEAQQAGQGIPHRLFRSWGKGSPPGSPPAPQEGSLLQSLLSLGCRFQGNLGSFTGFYGERVRNCALWLRQAGIYHCFGTDAHGPRDARFWEGAPGVPGGEEG